MNKDCWKNTIPAIEAYDATAEERAQAWLNVSNCRELLEVEIMEATATGKVQQAFWKDVCMFNEDARQTHRDVEDIRWIVGFDSSQLAEGECDQKKLYECIARK